MGVIWLQTTSGKLIRMPVVGPDVNALDDLIKIPTSVIGNDAINKNFSDKITVDIEGKGPVIFDFSVPGRTGSCKKCGYCCSHCEHVIVVDEIGKPNGALCDIRMNIFNISNGCTLAPDCPEQVHNYKDCGFQFEGTK